MAKASDYAEWEMKELEGAVTHARVKPRGGVKGAKSLLTIDSYVCMNWM